MRGYFAQNPLKEAISKADSGGNHQRSIQQKYVIVTPLTLCKSAYIQSGQ